MACGEFREMISVWMDEELEETRELFLMRHLVICSPCRDEYEKNLRLRDLLSDGIEILRAEVPTGFAARMASLIEAERDAVKSPAVAASFSSAAIPPRRATVIPGSFTKWAVAASLIVGVSTFVFYDRGHAPLSPSGELTDARSLKGNLQRTAVLDHKENKDLNALNAYIDRHSKAAYRAPAPFGGRVVYATMNRTY